MSVFYVNFDSFEIQHSLIQNYSAGVVKLVDTLDLGSSASRLGGSSPSTRTIKKESDSRVGFFFSIYTKKAISF